MPGPIGVSSMFGALAAGSVRSRRRSGGTAFEVADGAAADVASLDVVTGAQSVTAAFLLGLQEDETDVARDQAGHKRLREVMSELSGLQREILRGKVGWATLERLAQAARDVPVPADPVLRSLLEGGVLRARLELARFDAFRPRIGK